MDTSRCNVLVSNVIKKNRAVLMMGPVGNTSVAQTALNELEPMEYSFLVITISAQTSFNIIQEIIGARVEKRTKGV